MAPNAMRTLLLLVPLLATSAAAADVPHAAEGWANLFVQGRMVPPGETTSRALYYLEFQPRLSLSPAAADKVLLRGAVGWELARGLTAWAGVGAIPRWDGDRWRVSETRLWQQLMLSGAAGPTAGLLRLRLEQRTFEGAPTPSLRLRLMARGTYTLPLAHSTGWALVAFDEAFVGMAGDPARLGFDQNRAFVGLLHRLTPWFSVEAGYLNVYSRLAPEKVTHTALVQAIANLL